MDGVSGRHNRVVLNLARRIADLLEGTGCEVFAQSMKLRCADGVLYPNVMVICGKALAGNEQFVMAPTLVIKVLLPRRTGYVKRDKFLLYRTLASLREFVLVDAAARQVEVFTRAEEGVWQFMDQSGAAELSLCSIGCRLPLELIFKGVETESES